MKTAFALLALALAPLARADDAISLAPTATLRPAAWQPLAAKTSARAGAAVLVRGFRAQPTAMAFTVTATKRVTVRVFWSVYCEGFANDELLTHQGTITMRVPFSGYPTLLQDPTKCFVTVRATPPKRVKAHVAVFGY